MSVLLTLYFRKPLLGIIGLDGRPKKWRVDRFTCAPALKPEFVPSDGVVERMHGETTDQAGRAVPLNVLRRYDLNNGFVDAVMEARRPNVS